MYIILKIEKKVVEDQNSKARTIIIIAAFQYDYHILDIIYQLSRFCLLTHRISIKVVLLLLILLLLLLLLNKKVKQGHLLLLLSLVILGELA